VDKIGGSLIYKE